MSRLLDRRNARKVNVNGLRRDPRTGAGKLAKSERGYGGVLAFDFTDNSVALYDPTTQANIAYSQGVTDGNGNFRGPHALLTYTSPSNKLTMQSDGYIKYQAHNLYLNSAAPANQSITVVSGASYAVTITGTVSVTASGAATGTWTAGTNTFTAATTTLTLGSTSGSGTVHVRRTPSNDDYIETAGAAKYALPLEYDTSGSCLGLLVEEARTNLCLYSNDLTNAAWTKSNMTTAKTATGPDNAANSATTITATAGNATVLQAITSASAARVTSVFIKRRTGTGNIDLTQDNGSTWTTQAVDSTWTRFSLSSVTSANPTVGIRIVTSGDAVDVALFSHEVGAFVTSPILTYGAAATRAADNISIATSAFPHSATAGTMYANWQPRTVSGTHHVLSLSDGSVNESILVRNINTNPNVTVLDGLVSQANLDPGTASTAAQKISAAYEANNFGACYDGGTVVTDSSGTLPTVTTLGVGRSVNVSSELADGHIKAISYVPRRKTDAELQAETA